MSTLTSERVLTFNVVIETKDGAYVAYCLETGIVAAALSLSEVLSKMGDLIEKQVVFALENDRLGDIFHSASAEVWSRFLRTDLSVIARAQRVLSTEILGAEWLTSIIISHTAYASAR